VNCAPFGSAGPSVTTWRTSAPGSTGRGGRARNPPPESVAARGGARGATNKHPEDIAFPAAPEVVWGLGALLHSAGVARFLELGIPPEAFEDNARPIVGALLAGQPVDRGRVRSALERERPGELSLAESMLCLRVRDARHAVRAVDLLAEHLAARWLPLYLRWGAERLERGEPLAHVARDLDSWLGCARPCLFARERGAAA